MKCSNCGQETKNNICENCGNEVALEYSDTIDNTGKCPKCGSLKIAYERERIGTSRQYRSRKNYIGNGRQGKSVSQSVYRTVGVCQNCGYTWNPNATTSGTRSKTWLWVLGWILIFPLPLTIILLRKKDIAPKIRYGVIAIAWALFLIIALLGNTQTDTPQDSNTGNSGISTTTTTNTSKDVIYGNYIDTIVAQYNAQASEKLVFVETFTPSDKQSEHYRTEFRLTAFKDAVGKSYLLGNKVVDIVAYGTTTCRVYTNDVSFNQAIALIRGFSPIMDKTLTANDLQKAIDEITSKKFANGYYFGKLGLTFSGYDAKGYELMLKNE